MKFTHLLLSTSLSIAFTRLLVFESILYVIKIYKPTPNKANNKTLGIISANFSLTTRNLSIKKLRSPKLQNPAREINPEYVTLMLDISYIQQLTEPLI